MKNIFLIAGFVGGNVLSNLSFADDIFSTCIQDLQKQAMEQGFSSQTVENTLGKVQFNERVIELDRSQPEFTETFHNYLKKRVSEERIEQGRAMLAQHHKLLNQLTEKYGVPPQYIVAFWGMETNYGTYLGKMPVLDALATLACDTRRSSFFKRELFEAMKLVENNIVTTDEMLGSWAGAMGNMQFMPSTYNRYATDADGDNRPNLWKSIPDALTSAAYYLNSLGWVEKLRWGREVSLPENFPYEAASLNQSKPLYEWSRLGVTKTGGQTLPELDIQASVLLPSGHKGPAFMVYQNFNVIMKWNQSEFYALSVGHLADRINGAGQLFKSPPDTRRFAIDEIKQLQEMLNQKGYKAGTVDGIFGSGTRNALRAFQKDNGMIADGYPDDIIFESLRITETTEMQ